MFKNLFIPNEDNGFSPILLRKKLLLTYLLFMVLINLFFAKFLNEFPTSISKESLNSNSIINTINLDRLHYKQDILKTDKALTTIANKRLEDLVSYQYWDHVNPYTQSSISNISDIPLNRYTNIKEKLSKDYTSIDELNTAFLTSFSNRTDIIDSKYNSIGVSTTKENINNKVSNLVVIILASKNSTVDNNTSLVSAKTNTGIAVSNISFINMLDILMGIFLIFILILNSIHLRKNGKTKIQENTIFHTSILILFVTIGLIGISGIIV